MSINKIIVIVGIIVAVFIAFVFIQFNPLGKNGAITASKNDSTNAASTVTINDQTFTVAVARTEEEKQKGLSGRDSMPLDQGMLFVFDKPDMYSFWMKDMEFPIDIIFINDNKIVSISENVKPASSGEMPIYQPSQPSDKALEINAGLSKKYNFKPGDTVEINLK